MAQKWHKRYAITAQGAPLLHNVVCRSTLDPMLDDDDSLPQLRSGIRSIVGARIQEVYETAKFDLATWIIEVRGLAQAAAINGNYQTALDAYKTLGRHLGANVDGATTQASQHVHFHGDGASPVKEATKEEIENRLNHIRSKQADQHDDELDEILA